MANVTGTVVIDPGHGGMVKTGGSSANNATSPTGVLEKNMTLQLARLVRDSLARHAPSVTVILTRDSDDNLGLSARAKVARDNDADLFLSIHFNGFNERARGVETLVRARFDGNVNVREDKEFATRVQKAVHRAIESRDPATVDRGVKEQSLGVLADGALGNTPEHHPCRACLLEVEFIDVPAVDRLLNTGPNAAAVRAEIATAIKDAIVEQLSQ